MEAIAGLSLACNIVQVIGYGVKAVEIIAQVYRDGKSCDNAIIQTTTERLQSLCTTIDSQKTDLTAGENELRQIVAETTAVAAELVQVLSKLKGTGSTWRKVKAGLASVYQKTKVEKLQQQLKDCERRVNTGILVTLREQNVASMILQEKSFSDLNTTLQTFIVRLAQGQTQTGDLIKTENEATRALILQTKDVLSSKFDSVEASKRRTQLLNSLRYPEMNARLNQIADASTGTYDAFFEPSSHRTLSTWFKEGSGMLWVKGKAGSGKSTLMKYIMQSGCLTSLIGKTEPKFVMLSHFFWLSGAPCQRNLHGMLCSLAYQLVGLTDQVQNEGKLYVDDWSMRELEALVLSSLGTLAVDTTIIILLDALDEYDEKYDRRKLLAFINKLSSHAHVCLSSRPEPFWIQHLQCDSSFNLEDITQDAIKTFVHQQFEELQLKVSQELISTLTNRADGVFLWARIAVEDVLRGLDINSTDAELRQRVIRLPRGMENLYEEMLQRVKEDWPLVEKEAAVYFSTALLLQNTQIFEWMHGTATSYVCQHSVALKTVLGQQPNYQSMKTVEDDCMRLKDRIRFVCAGMLQVAECEQSHLPERLREAVETTPNMLATVEFTHRTARDFLLEAPFGQRLINLDTWDPISVVCNLIEAECYFYRFGTWAEGWFPIVSILGAVHKMQKNLNLQDQAYLKMIRSCRKLLAAMLAFNSGPSSLPIEFTHRRHFDSDSTAYWTNSVDMLGVTLEHGSIVYFNSLSLKLENFTVEYMEYLLYCTVMQVIFASEWSDKTTAYCDMWKILKSYGIHGSAEFWVRNFDFGDPPRPYRSRRPCAHRRSANENLLGIILENASHRSRVRIENFDLCRALYVLDESGVNHTDVYTYCIDSYGQMSVYASRPDLFRGANTVLCVEGNLKFWLSCLCPNINTSQYMGQLKCSEDGQATIPFRRLRYVAIKEDRAEGHGFGVPVFMKDRLATELEDGETILQLWERASRQKLSHPERTQFSDEDQKRINCEADRLIQAIRNQLQADAHTFPEFHDLTNGGTRPLHFNDYLEIEGFARRDKAMKDIDIPVFKEGLETAVSH